MGISMILFSPCGKCRGQTVITPPGNRITIVTSFLSPQITHDGSPLAPMAGTSPCRTDDMTNTAIKAKTRKRKMPETISFLVDELIEAVSMSAVRFIPSTYHPLSRPVLWPGGGACSDSILFPSTPRLLPMACPAAPYGRTRTARVPRKRGRTSGICNPTGTSSRIPGSISTMSFCVVPGHFPAAIHLESAASKASIISSPLYCPERMTWMHSSRAFSRLFNAPRSTPRRTPWASG